MPNATLTLWIDSAKNSLMSGWQTSSNAVTPTLKQGDTLGIELHWVRAVESAGTVMEEIAWSPSATMTLAVGNVDALPTFGSYTLTFGGDETTPLAFNATASQVQTALNALASITAVGGITVSTQGKTFRIVFNTAQVLVDTLGYGDNDLFPSTSIGIVPARVGTATVKPIYHLSLKQSPAAATETFTNQDDATATVTVVKTAAFTGDRKIWRLAISPAPKEGSFNLSYEVGGVQNAGITLQPTASAQDVADGLNSLTTFNAGWFVTKSGQYSWDISTTANYSNLTADDGGLISFNAKYCELSLNSVDMENLLGGKASVNATLELEVIQSGIRQTLIQTPVRIVNDLIDESNYTIVERGEVMPVESVVRYDTSQALTTPQKETARTNINALSSGDSVFTTLQSAVAGFEGRTTALEGVALSNDEYNAVTGANAPSATNVMATMTDVATKANVSHTHSIANVTGLQGELDALDTGKASVTHTHDTSDITGLVTTITTIESDISALETGKSDTTHTHTNLPAANEKGALENADSPTSANPYVTVSYLAANAIPSALTIAGNTTTPFNNTTYPYEIEIVIGGAIYKIPARI